MRPTILPAVLTVAVLMGMPPEPSAAQACPLAPGCTRTLEETFPFATADRSLWGPEGDESLLSGIHLTLFDEAWDVSGDDSDSQSFSGWWGTWKFGGGVSAATRGRVASYFDVTKFGKATVDVDYPVTVAVTVPEPNTFRPGEAVAIHTAWAPIEDQADFTTDLWAMDLELRGLFGMHHSADYDICLVSCSNDNEFFPTMDVSETPFRIFRAQGGSFGIGDEEVTDAASLADFLASTFTGITAYVKAPEPLESATLSGTALYANGSDEWARLDVDIDNFLRFVRVIPGLPFPPLGACLELEDYGAFDLCYETVDLDSQFRIIQDEDVSFDASVRVRVDFPGPLGYDVVAPDGSVTSSGTGASVSFPVGHDLRVYTPESTEPFALSPTFGLDNTISRESGLRVNRWMTNRELQLSFDMAQVSHTGSRYHPLEREWISCSSIISAGSAGEFFSRLTSCVAGTISGVWKTIEDAWTEWVTKTANAIDFDLGPLVDEDFAEAETAIPLFDRSWVLGGFEDFPGEILILDPEDPRIAVTTSVVNALYTTGQNPGQVIQTITVTNEGDVPLTLAEILDALSAPGLSVEALSSGDVTANAGFDGVGNPETLAGGSLGLGASATLTVRVAAASGLLHTADVSTLGRSPIGSDVRATAPLSFAVFDMVMSPYKVEYKRGKGEGKLKARVCSSAALDVRAIDAASLRLEGVAPSKLKLKRSDHDDEDDDGDDKKCAAALLELTFDRGDVIEALLARTATQAVLAQSVVRPVFEPGLDRPVADVAKALLSGRGLSAGEGAALDRAGNRNGRVDLGDLRAYAFGDPALVVAMGGGSQSESRGSKDNNDGGKKAPTHTVVLSGTLQGALFWAEAPIHLKIEKEDD